MLLFPCIHTLHKMMRTVMPSLKGVSFSPPLALSSLVGFPLCLVSLLNEYVLPCFKAKDYSKWCLRGLVLVVVIPQVASKPLLDARDHGALFADATAAPLVCTI